MTQLPSCPGEDEVRVWHARTAELWSDAGTEARAMTLLSPAERERHGRFRHAADAAMFLAGRVMARTLVGAALGVAPDGWRWCEGPRGRPEIDEVPGRLSFNIAHSGGLVVCALAATGPVGVDVECRSRAPIDPGLVTRYGSPHEIADVRAQGPDGWRDRFLQYWTLKEAYLKARGLGIGLPLAEVSFERVGAAIHLHLLGSLAGTPGAWAFDLRTIDDDYYVAVAVAAEDGASPRVCTEPFSAALLP